MIKIFIIYKNITSLIVYSIFQYLIFIHIYTIYIVISQFYESQVYDEYVIKGNAAVLKCNIPSFVSDHVEIIEWIDTNGGRYSRDDSIG